jgi:hypothetical protein
MTWRRRISSFDIVEAPMKMLVPKYSEGSLRDLAFHHRDDLLGGVPAAEVLVPLPLHVGRPIGRAFGDDELQVGMPFERSGEQQVPQRTRAPPHHLGEVDADLVVELVAGRLARMRVNGQLCGRTRRPHRIVGRVVVGRAVVPHRRDHDAANARLAGQILDLGDGAFDVVSDGHQRDARSPFGTRRAEFDEELVVRACPGKREVGIFDRARRQARAERRRFHTRDRVAVGENDFCGHAVGVELFVAMLRVVGAFETLFVLRLPVHDVVVVEPQLLGAPRLALGQKLVELRVVLGLEVGAIVLALQAGVPVGRHDDVAIHRYPLSSDCPVAKGTPRWLQRPLTTPAAGCVR